MFKILICSPIRQKPEILNQFLTALREIENGANEILYYFIDDNVNELSREMLLSFQKEVKNVIVKNAEEMLQQKDDADYVCNDNSHFWNTENIKRITFFKDSAIDFCKENKIDYLFLIDSDIVINKQLLLHLLSKNVDIVSDVFWTQWHPNEKLLPQCFWIPDVFQQFKSFNNPLSFKEANGIKESLIEKLKKPGLYKVDGLGACTLIKREALEKGVCFKEIPNLSIPGEDRHFCIRAGALGIDLYIDTVYPAYHIFREEYLSRVDEFKKEGFKFDMCQTYTETENDVKKGLIFNLKRKTVILLKRITRHLEK